MNNKKKGDMTTEKEYVDIEQINYIHQKMKKIYNKNTFNFYEYIYIYIHI